MKKIKKLKWLSLLTLPVIVAPIIASCSNISSTVQYDLILSSNPLTSLNYIKYNDSRKVIPSLVESIFKQDPSAELKEILQGSPIARAGIYTVDANVSTFDQYLEKNNSHPRETNAYFEVSDLGFAPGVLDNLVSQTYNIRAVLNSSRRAYSAVFDLNKGKSVWENLEPVTAQDFVDAIHYILDFNVGSQKQIDVVRMNIKNTQRLIDAQTEYLSKFKKTYENPFGKRKFIKAPWNNNLIIEDPDEEVWNSQNPGDELYVAAIKEAATSLGIFSGQLFLNFTNEQVFDSLSLAENELMWRKEGIRFDIDADSQIIYIKNPEYNTLKKTAEELRNIPKLIKTKLIKNPYRDPRQRFDLQDNNLSNAERARFNLFAADKYKLRFEFEDHSPRGFFDLLRDLRENLLPINRKYVEYEIGGIHKFGTAINKFMKNGPFKIDSGILGPQGYLILKKDENYYSADRTLSSLIKIQFLTDLNIAFTLFEDGLLSATDIPAVRQIDFWSDPIYKELMTKAVGYGTIGLQLNLDKETNGDSALQDEDLRNAIYYAINRSEILKIVGWDSSFPVNTWSAFGQAVNSSGDPLEMYFSNKKTTARNNKQYDLQNYDHVVHLAKSYSFEHVSRKDKTYDLETARFYLERYKKKNPNKDKVTLRFLNDSTDEQIQASIGVQNLIKNAFDGYIDVEIKGLPANTFADFVDTGKYDIVYTNFDRFGTNPESYVSVFFQTDEISKEQQKITGFRLNPSGSWTYSTYFNDIIYQKINHQDWFNNNIKTRIDILNSLDVFNVVKNSFLDDKLSFSQKEEILNQHFKEINDLLKQNNLGLVNSRFINVLIKYLNQSNNDILLKELFYESFKQLSNEQVLDFVVGETNRNQIPNDNKDGFILNKIIELAYQKENESSIDWSKRITSFFANILTPKELKEGWNEDWIFETIANLEKIVRDGVPVIPLIEVDTKWEISRVAGVSSLHSYSLQYAYDISKPPRPDLPRRIRR